MPPGTRRAIVVGSGPAGVACAAALAAGGIRPLVLDGGRRLEEARTRTVAALAATEPAAWDGSVLAELRRSFPVDADALPLKPIFGSLYPYAADDPAAPFRGEGSVPSLAVGGLSAVWGAAMLPYGEREHAGWPFAARELAEHYRAVLGFVPLAGEVDALGEVFPLYVDRPGGLRPTPQVEALLADLSASRKRLARAGVLAGRARLAVRTAGRDGCRYAGICMLGCPYGSIWSAAQTLDALLADGRVDHRPGAVVESFGETGDGVRVRLAGGGELRAERLFVAAGALASARLFLASTDWFDRPLALRDSAYYTVPLLRLRRPRDTPGEPGNVLAQVFLELDDPAVSAHRIHLQLYGYNDLMLRAVAARARLPEPAAARLLAPLLGRLLYLQGYLHSDESAGLTATLTRERGRDVLVVEGQPTGDARPRAVLAKLRSLRRELGLVPLDRMLHVWPPGKGFHVGGSLPMRERPGELESDVLGRPYGFRRVHVVDASVLPTVPAQTITLPTMANAHRIGTLAFES